MPSRMSCTTRSPLTWPDGRSTWVTSPVTTTLRAEPEPGEEHLHLLGGGVLGLVEDDERVVEGPATHVRQGGDLDRAGGHQPRDRVGVEHVVQARRRAGAGTGRSSGTACRAGNPAARPASTAGRVKMIRLTSRPAGPGRPWPSRGRSCRCRPGRCRTRWCAGRWRPRTASGSASWAGSCGRGGQDAERQHVGRPLDLTRRATWPGCGCHRVAGQSRPACATLDELVEKPGMTRAVSRGAGDGDLVAADVDVGVDSGSITCSSSSPEPSRLTIEWSAYPDLHHRPRFALGPVISLPLSPLEVLQGTCRGSSFDAVEFDALEDPEDRPRACWAPCYPGSGFGRAEPVVQDSSISRPPRTCRWTCGTSWPASAPVLKRRDSRPG